jgi:hypothetical protein
VHVRSARLFYGNEQVEEPWWAALGKRVTDAIDWILTFMQGDKATAASIAVKIVRDVFNSASGSVRAVYSNGVTTVTWIKGWAESPPPTVVILIDRIASQSPYYTEWRYFREGYPTSSLTCGFTVYRNVNTNMYLPPSGVSRWALVKIWTWRGQTQLSTDALTIGAR